VGACFHVGGAEPLLIVSQSLHTYFVMSLSQSSFTALPCSVSMKTLGTSVPTFFDDQSHLNQNFTFGKSVCLSCGGATSIAVLLSESVTQQKDWRVFHHHC